MLIGRKHHEIEKLPVLLKVTLVMDVINIFTAVFFGRNLK